MIQEILGCSSDAELLAVLQSVRDRPRSKVETTVSRGLCLVISHTCAVAAQEDFLVWVDVFDRFDEVLSRCQPADPASTYNVDSVRLLHIAIGVVMN